MNIVLLQGRLSSEPRERALPSGSHLLNWEVTTCVGDDKHTVPVVWFDPPRSAQLVGAGEEVVVLGTVRRRFYVTPGGTASSTEVLAEKAARATRTREVHRLVELAQARLPEAVA